VDGEQEIDQGPGEKGPYADVRIGLELGKEQDAADDEDQSAELLRDGVDGLAAELGAAGRVQVV